jgi:hypothetical protein
MSARFAIPATSFVLKALIEADLKLAYTGFTAPKVSIAPPPRPAPSVAAGAAGAADQPEVAGLILYMHHVAPNAAFRSMSLGYIEDDLSASMRTPLVLDLHYLLAATGADLEREALLGIAMAALHRSPIVERAQVSAILGAVNIPANPTSMMQRLTAEPLADPRQHPERIKLSQHPLDIDMSTKLWSAMQSPIRPSAYYLVTTTFLDTDDSQPDGPLTTDVTIAARPSANPAADPVDDAVVAVRATP